MPRPIEFKTSKTIHNQTTEKPTYDDVTTTQQGINMAVAEGRVVRYLTNKTSKEIMSQVVDMKGCTLRKPSKDSTEVAIIPGFVEDFDFENVDTTVVTATRPQGRIITL